MAPWTYILLASTSALTINFTATLIAIAATVLILMPEGPQKTAEAGWESGEYTFGY